MSFVTSGFHGFKQHTVYPKKYAHGFCFAVLCCGFTLTDLPISIRLTSLALWQSNDCPSASKATLMNMDKYFMWIHYERLHNHNKAKHNKTVCIFLRIYCTSFCDVVLNEGPALMIWRYHVISKSHYIYHRTAAMGTSSGLILGLRPANERRRYKVTPSLIGWALT